jgi:hypothetical protein
MLFPLDPNTPRCSVFTVLNDELLYFLQASIESNEISRELFTAGVGQACWDNLPTKEKFESVWNNLPDTQDEKLTIFNNINDKQNMEQLFGDRGAQFPTIQSEPLRESLKLLTKHLFKSTKDLAGIKAACGDEDINSHFLRFCALNFRLCQTCGTELLAQPRADVESEGQWRSAYDHLLSKDKHPSYAIHPGNLIPLCDTCNGKAKRAKELLLSPTGARRLAFYPFTESCMDVVTGELREQPDELSCVLEVSWHAHDADHREKLEAWNEIYQVKSRVEGIESDYVLKLNDDLDQPEDLAEFKQQLAIKARPPHNRALRTKEMKFWKYKLYEWLSGQQDDFIEAIWEMILHRRDDDSYMEEYGV